MVILNLLSRTFKFGNYYEEHRHLSQRKHRRMPRLIERNLKMTCSCSELY